MNQEYIVFSSALSDVAEKNYAAGVAHEEAGQFVNKIFNLYKESGLPTPNIDWIDKVPANVKKWMKTVLDNEFHYMKEPPIWLYDASWRFINEEPMIFISQVEFIDNEMMGNKLSTDDVLYTFAGRKKTNDGWGLIIKMVKQSKASVGTTYIY
ncbi:hypothetical protein [Pectobacterium parmentieri]|uniref:hypothetical protein n=1 Tax=Pectobacterium parmentieri TaxID=1905730 RepID=UPI001373ECC2|nr:hypothetical protein [Pectobacterium parmentieri]MBI0552804.1 hypothetical protein [Pectobacterium parmentieri]MBI0566104.1 hypothetical protein [Pectobacterium parmentieri]QHQ15539.1 hypothetical protein GMW39_06470 [Pectobacterium parmentieri]QQA78010.1 hypothetical protein JBL47_10800 [Pectobacterium parmentieri]